MHNPSFNASNDSYYLQEKRFLWHLFPDGPNKVLDLGCGAGGVGNALLKGGKASEVTGAEIFEPAAAEARKHYKEVYVGDIERMELPYNNYFDVVVCGDVLEHLIDPKKMLERLHQMIKTGGIIICCLPNVRHYRVVGNLLIRGEWRYVQHGIMDQTHLRFFTTKSFRRLLNETSFTIESQGMQIYKPFDRLVNQMTFGMFGDFFGFQIFFSARK